MDGLSEHQSLERAFAQLFLAIAHCVVNRLRIPALILLYSGIDIASSLDSDKLVRERFTDWVDKYMLPSSSLQCSADDLYGARCGIVHTYSPVSDLSKSGKVTTIGYAWRPDTAAKLEKLVAAGAELSRRVGSTPEHFIAVQGEDLLECFWAGVQSFLGELERDPARAKAAYAKAGHFLADVATEKAEDMLMQAETVLGRKF